MFSSLVNSIIRSPYYYGERTAGICVSTPHHAVMLNASAEDIARVFIKEGRNASCNYTIGVKGDICGVVDEEYASMCSSSYENDNKAITFEVANDGGEETGWHVSDATIESLIRLNVDICKRYNFRLKWTGDTDGSLTVHRMFEPTACPGDYLMSKMPWIAEEVNRRLDYSDRVGWNEIEGVWYYFEDGEMVKHEFRQDKKGDWYFLGDDGAMLTNDWISWKNRWCYVGADGKAYTNGWYCIDGTWYIFDEDGYSLYSQWYKNDNGTWSYLDEDCKAVTGWKELEWDGQLDWYYFDNEGTMMTNTWNNDYFVGGDGKMLKSTWIGHENKYYWVDSNGRWDSSKPTWYSEGIPNDGYPVYEY